MLVHYPIVIYVLLLFTILLLKAGINIGTCTTFPNVGLKTSKLAFLSGVTNNVIHTALHVFVLPWFLLLYNIRLDDFCKEQPI